MKGCIVIDESVSQVHPSYKKKNKELHIKPKKKSMEDKELETYKKNYKYGAENNDDEDEDFPWEDGIERIEKVSKGEKIKSTPWNTETQHERNEDENDGEVEGEKKGKSMEKGKRKAIVKMLVKKKMRSKKEEY